MKFFKRLTLLMALLVSVLAMTACSSTSLSINGYLWFKNTSAFKPGWSEVSTYGVSLVHTTPINTEELADKTSTIEILDGSYTTTLQTKTDNGNYYVYETNFSLTFTGEVEDENGDKVIRTFYESFSTKSEFKDTLEPIKTEKVYSSDSSNYKYNYLITYSGSTATAVLKESDINGLGVNEQTFTFKKFNKKTYIDNDLLLLIPRLFNVDKSFSRSFRTIDVLSNKMFDMNMYGYNKNSDLHVENFANYTLNGVDLSVENPEISCAHIEMVINDTFSGYPLEAYFAQDRDTHRHRLVTTYTRFGDRGYLKFSLENVVVTGD
ncbi:MAG: hypothetical protein J6V66_06915 [Clostridia bacterium]|nr:hypothetical protein [Clostridia bacterium]